MCNRYAAVVQAEDPSASSPTPATAAVRGKKRYPNLDLIAQNTYRGWYRGAPWEFEEMAPGDALRLGVRRRRGGQATTPTTADAWHDADVFEPEEYRQVMAEVQFQTVFRDHPRQVPDMVWILRDFAIDKYKGAATPRGS